MDQFEQNFQGLLGWSQVTFGWVVLLPSPHRVGLGLHLGLFPEILQVHGFWGYWGLLCHFGKDLTRQTKM